MSVVNMDSKTEKTASVLVVEDDPLMRRHFEFAVEAHPGLSLFGSVGSCRACRELLKNRPDIMLVDLGLPDGNGADLIRQLKSMHPSSEAIVVSVFAEEDRVVAAIRAGASGYLLKDMLKEDIGASIMDVLNGGSPISPSIARYILKALNVSSHHDGNTVSDLSVELSKREIEVLHMVSRGCSRKEIASILGLSHHTVVSHIRHIYEKLGVHSRNEAVFEACQKGLIQIYD